MLADIFYWVLNMSISASIVGVTVLLLGKISRIPRNIIAIMWAIPFIRMWVPVGMGSRYSLMSLISRFTTRTVTVYFAPEFTMSNHIMAADSYFPVTYEADIIGDVMRVASAVWAVVAAALILAFTFIYLGTVAELKDAQHLRDNIYISAKVSGPCVYGVFKPRIILPGEENDYVLKHETAHIKRFDNLWRIVAIVSACVHWFNPLSWLFLKAFLRDSELACDESVLKSLCPRQRKEYALTLLEHAGGKTVYASPFGGAGIRVRIEKIMSYKRLSAMSVTAFIMLAVAIAYVLLTNAK